MTDIESINNRLEEVSLELPGTDRLEEEAYRWKISWQGGYAENLTTDEAWELGKQYGDSTPERFIPGVI